MRQKLKIDMDLQLQPFSAINLADSFFDSLKEAYPEFSVWYNKKAIDTLMYCDLNNHDQFRKKRLSIENSLKEKIGVILRFYTTDKDYWSKWLLCLMRECGRAAAYSATKATLFLTNSDYACLKQLLIDDGRWDDDFVKAEAELEFCALPK